MFDRGGAGMPRGGGAPMPGCADAFRGGGTGKFEPPIPEPGRIGGGGSRDVGAPSPEERICGGAATGGVGAGIACGAFEAYACALCSLCSLPCSRCGSRSRP